jgi:hypothetical protein
MGASEGRKSRSRNDRAEARYAGYRRIRRIENALSGLGYWRGISDKSTMGADGSGRPPAMVINAITSMPAHPPPKNATNTHHIETIWSPRFLWFRRCRNYAPATPLDPLARRRSSCPEGVRESPAQPKTARRLCEGTPCLRLSNQYSQRLRFDQENIGKDQAEPQPKGLRRSLDDRQEDTQQPLFA